MASLKHIASLSIYSLKQVTTYKRLAHCDVEELATTVRHGKAVGGVQFARTEGRAMKDAARYQVLRHLTVRRRPEFLKILSMPGLDWRFERKLLGRREGDWMRNGGAAINTAITAIENDRYIYYSAAHRMPGLHTSDGLTKHFRTVEPFAERTLQTKFIDKFHFANVDDLMTNTREVWDAAWLDYTGPLTIERLQLIAHFFQQSVRDLLVVTALRARYNKPTTDAIVRAGGHYEWLFSHLPGEVVHEIDYFDTVPMAQFAVRHVGGNGGVNSPI